MTSGSHTAMCSSSTISSSNTYLSLIKTMNGNHRDFIVVEVKPISLSRYNLEV